MKMYSYIELNRELSIKYKRHLLLKEEIPIWIHNHCMENDDKGYSLDEQSELSQLETELKYLEEELIHGKSRYPENLTFTNYVDYLAVPTLVYWMEYPRTEK
jgi:sterol O-acyltransferase